MDDHVVEIADAAMQAEISAITPGLRSVDTETTEINGRRQIAVRLRDRMTGDIAGRLTGRTKC